MQELRDRDRLMDSFDPARTLDDGFAVTVDNTYFDEKLLRATNPIRKRTLRLWDVQRSGDARREDPH